MHRFRRSLAALLIGAGLVTLGGAAVGAQDASPEASASGLPSGCTVVADGLINPRYVDIGDDGSIYVTEAGNGGDEVVEPAASDEGTAEAGSDDEAPQVESSPAPSDEEASGEEGGPGGGPVTRGDSGQVTVVSPDGTQSVLADGFPSYTEGIGPTGIVVANGAVWISIGGVAATLGAEPAEGENSIQRIDLATGEATQVAYLGQYELDNNPDGTDINPNLYGMDPGFDGALYVNDAGGNTVYRVDPATGDFTLLGIVPSPNAAGGDLEANASPVADETAGGPLQPVPTGLHVGVDGNVYVVTLGALAPQAAQLLIAQADGSFVAVATGLTVGIGVAGGPDGALYVSELATFAGEQPGPGRVLRVNADGTTETVLENVPFAHGIAFDTAGNLYVVANSTAFGPPPAEPNGQVWRCDGIAAGA